MSHYSSPHEFVCVDCGRVREINLTPGEAAPDRCVLCRRRERLESDNAALRAALVALINSLPKCDWCTKPAVRAWRRGEARYCDEHAADMDGPSSLAPEYPRAAPLRALIKLLEER